MASLAGVRWLHVPASPVAATDLMKYRCATKKISSIGARLITLPAISSVHSVAWAPWNVASPSGSVIWFVEVMAISGHRKLFHESRNVRAASVASAGIDSGRTMRHSTLSLLAPSTRADSSYSTGSVLKNCRRKKMPNAVAALGRISAPMWLMPTWASTWTPSHLVMMNWGIIVTWNGTMSVAMITANSSPRPRKRSRAKAYPASEQNTRLHSTVVTATTALLRKNRPNGAAARAFV